MHSSHIGNKRGSTNQKLWGVILNEGQEDYTKSITADRWHRPIRYPFKSRF